MIGVLRRCCSLLVQLVLRLTQPFKSSKPPTMPDPPPQDDWSGMGWGQDGEEWEPFSVKVVPNETCVQEEQRSGVSAPHEQTETDLFSDMEPVFRKPTKIRITRREEKQGVDMNKFSIQDTPFQQDEVVGDLGLWTDDVGGGGGWEEGVGEDEGDLIRESQEVLREKRKQERERRRAQQEILRAQLKSGGYAHGLGTRVT